ncbi:hypothetical protein VM1G_04343 [Cytospora mali]|uniref:Uncharacterized protein n=1 Tax=Cytospora mali TaxID=578113 RepID=A0A194VW59_CYTMA|nr:hypothetical protein VM1G_04343 [Valsa mali]
MDAFKNAALTGLVSVRGVVTPENVQAGLAVVADKGRAVAEAAPGAANQAAEWVAEKGKEAVEAAPGAANQAAEWVAEKGKEVVEAAPGAANQAAEWITENGKKAVDAAPGAANQRKAKEWAAANPGSAVCVGVGVVGVGLLVAPMAAATPVLGAVGFGPDGVAGGSIAAGAQAGMGGSVAAGSAFATAQSAAMGGYGVGVVAGAVQGVGAALAGTAGIAGWMQAKKARPSL